MYSLTEFCKNLMPKLYLRKRKTHSVQHCAGFQELPNQPSAILNLAQKIHASFLKIHIRRLCAQEEIKSMGLTGKKS